MLLVRRDADRQIRQPEGVAPSLTEQRLLLRRLAYWLMRNDLADAERADVVDQINRCLHGMPHLAERADNVFRHLLLRTGLLREPIPGRVDFVHRTFQDYLCAEAAIEAGDLGMLAGKAHEDTWHDVVVMAIAHARCDERTALLRELLRRARHEPAARLRLRLVAAAGLEQAPEIDPGVAGEVRAAAAEHLPPKDLDDARLIAEAGEFVLSLLASMRGLSPEQIAATIRTAALIGGDAALRVICRWRRDARPLVQRELIQAWGAFDADMFAREVLADTPLADTWLTVRTAAEIATLRHLDNLSNLVCDGNIDDIDGLARLRGLRRLVLRNNATLPHLDAVARLALDDLHLIECWNVGDLAPLAATKISRLNLSGHRYRLDLSPLAQMRALRHLCVREKPLGGDLRNLPQRLHLTSLQLHDELPADGTLRGVERWPTLEEVHLRGTPDPFDLTPLAALPRLTSLHVANTTPRAVGFAAHLPRLRHLHLELLQPPTDLAPLARLDGLRRLTINVAPQLVKPALDLAPFATAPDLAIEISGANAHGVDLLRPGQVTNA